MLRGPWVHQQQDQLQRRWHALPRRAVHDQGVRCGGGRAGGAGDIGGTTEKNQFNPRRCVHANYFLFLLKSDDNGIGAILSTLNICNIVISISRV